jgi:hypothetical protein
MSGMPPWFLTKWSSFLVIGVSTRRSWSYQNSIIFRYHLNSHVVARHYTEIAGRGSCLDSSQSRLTANSQQECHALLNPWRNDTASTSHLPGLGSTVVGVRIETQVASKHQQHPHSSHTLLTEGNLNFFKYSLAFSFLLGYFSHSI